MKIATRLFLPVGSASLVLFVTSSYKLALLAFAVGALVSVTPVLERAVSRISRAIGNTFFVSGAVFVVFVTRLIAPSRGSGTWQVSPQRSVSSSTYSSIPRTRTWGNALRGTTALVLLVAIIDVTIGNSLTNPPLIDPSMRLETTPSVKPGDIEYQIQIDGENLYLKPTPGPRWYLKDIASETTNWNAEEGRSTYNASSTTSRTKQIAVIGGSAAFGFGQSDAMTIASGISRVLSVAGQDVRVANFGIPGYTTSQAVRDLEDRLQEGLRIDVVVAYTGANDVFLGLGGRRVPQTLLDGATKVPSGPLTWWLNHSALSRIAGRDPVLPRPLMKRSLGSNSDGSWSIAARPMEESVKDAVYSLEEGYKELQELGQKWGVKVVFVYQPTWYEARLTAIDYGALNVDVFGRELLGASWQAIRYWFLSAHADVVDAKSFIDNKTCWIDSSHTRGNCSDDIARALVNHPQWKLAVAGTLK